MVVFPFLHTLQESSRCCAMVETFSTTVRSRDCAACEMNVTVSMGTSVTPNLLAVNDEGTQTFRTKLMASESLKQT